jgi:hypothetical protein
MCDYCQYNRDLKYDIERTAISSGFVNLESIDFDQNLYKNYLLALDPNEGKKRIIEKAYLY